MTATGSLSNSRRVIPAEHNITKISKRLLDKIYLCPDEELALKNLEHTFEIIDGYDGLVDDEKKEIMTLLKRLYYGALPYFRAGNAENPIYHHTQVLYNMARLVPGEECSYEKLKNLLVLALLHDIGNAICTHKKVTTDDIKDAFKKADLARSKTKKTELTEKAIDLAREARAFRLEHMDKGPEWIRRITEKYVEEGLLEEEGLHLICRAVAIHDYPSIEKNLYMLRERGIPVKHEKGVFLLPFNDPAIGRLVTLLREADRLFMVSVQGVIKNLKDKKIEVITKNVLERGKSNIRNHKGEYNLYKEADFLFEIGLRYETDLNNRSVSESLRKKLKNKNISLPQCATIQKIDNEWVINDSGGRRIHTIRKGEDKLKIYKPDKDDGKFINNESLYRTDIGYYTIFAEAKSKYKFSS